LDVYGRVAVWPCGLTCFHGRVVGATGGRGEFNLLLDPFEKPKIPRGDRREAEGFELRLNLKEILSQEVDKDGFWESGMIQLSLRTGRVGGRV